jgi:hypothetical protein
MEIGDAPRFWGLPSCGWKKEMGSVPGFFPGFWRRMEYTRIAGCCRLTAN